MLKVFFKRMVNICHRNLLKNVFFKVLCLCIFILGIRIYHLLLELFLTEDFQNFDYPLAGDIYQKIELHGSGVIPMTNPAEFRVKTDHVKKREGLLFLYLIKTRYESVEMRELIRRTWTNQKCADKIGVKWAHVFLLGELDENTETSNRLRKQIRMEAEVKKDIIILDYLDNYYNNTFKVIGGLDYGIKAFPDARYLVIVDDDYFVHPVNHAEYIKSIHPARYDIFVGGSNWYKSRPKRSSSKWSISYETYPFSVFPDYPAGGHIIFSMPIAKKIAIAFRYTAYMAFDDVLIGIILFKLGIAPKQVVGMCKTGWEYNNLKYSKLISFHTDKDPRRMKREWKKFHLDEFCEL